MKKIFLFTFLILLQTISALEFRTIIFSDLYSTIEPGSDFEIVRQRNYIRPQIYLDLFDYTAELNISAEFYYDYFNSETTPDLFNILREAYLSLYLPWGDLIIGQKFTTKGKADVFSPLNIFNASYRELYSLDDPYQGKRAEAGVELKFYISDESSLELFYIPFPRPDYQDNNEIYIDELSLTLDKSSAPYLLDDSHSLFLTYNRYGYTFDMQFTYAYYVDGNYNYVLDATSEFITKTYNRVQTIGGAISTSIGPFSISEELAFNLTEDFDGNDIGIKNSDITLNSQIMKTIFGRTFAQINIIYQHVFNYQTSEGLSEAINDIHLQPTDNILFFIGHLHDSFLREKLYVGLNLGYFFSPSIYIAPRVNYKYSDNITIESGIDMYTGEYKNKLFEDNLGGDNIYIRIKFEY